MITGKHECVAPSDRVCALTDVGKVRARNEDAAFAADDGSLLVVADGLGGLPDGDVASRAAVRRVVEALTEAAGAEPLADDDDAAWEQTLGRAFERAQRALLAEAKRRETGMATTLVVSAVTPRRLFTCHVGDVRAYLGRGGQLEQLTSDHSVVGELVTDGEISAEQARLHPERHIVTEVLGSTEGFCSDFVACALKSGDTVLLCSDGLWEAMPSADIAEILARAASAEDRANVLLTRALQAGGHDNISAVIYEHV